MDWKVDCTTIFYYNYNNFTSIFYINKFTPIIFIRCNYIIYVHMFFRVFLVLVCGAFGHPEVYARSADHQTGGEDNDWAHGEPQLAQYKR